MSKLTAEQFQLDCELILTVYGAMECHKFWATTVSTRCKTYQEYCMYWVGSAAPSSRPVPTGDRILQRATFLRHRDRTSQLQTV